MLSSEAAPRAPSDLADAERVVILSRLAGMACLTPPPLTPDGRYIVVRGRLWRAADPALPPDRRETLVRDLMDARRAVGRAKRAGDVAAEQTAHQAVQIAKVALGERGEPWWNDGTPDFNRHLAKNTPYADWYATVARNDACLP